MKYERAIKGTYEILMNETVKSKSEYRLAKNTGLLKLNNTPYITAVIIDDEINHTSNLRVKLEEIDTKIKIIGVASSVDKGIRLIECNDPDLVFLKVEMPGQSGFDLLEAIGKPKFKIIFVSRFSEYAIKAIKFSALDYLLKPIGNSELKQCLERSLVELTEAKRSFQDIHVSKTSELTTDIIIASLKGFIRLFLKDILYIEGKSGNYSIFHTVQNKVIISCKPLIYYENILPQESFFRNHRSYMVNLRKVHELDINQNILTLVNGQSIALALRKKAKLIRCLKSRISIQ